METMHAYTVCSCARQAFRPLLPVTTLMHRSACDVFSNPPQRPHLNIAHSQQHVCSSLVPANLVQASSHLLGCGSMRCGLLVAGCLHCGGPYLPHKLLTELLRVLPVHACWLHARGLQARMRARWWQVEPLCTLLNLLTLPVSWSLPHMHACTHPSAHTHACACIHAYW